jgi:hypothetical protein
VPEPAAREQAVLELAALEPAAREQAVLELAALEPAAREQAVLELAAREPAAREPAARELAALELDFVLKEYLLSAQILVMMLSQKLVLPLQNVKAS